MQGSAKSFATIRNADRGLPSIAAFSMRAHVAYIYVRGEFIRGGASNCRPRSTNAYDAGLLAPRTTRTAWDFDIFVQPYRRRPL